MLPWGHAAVGYLLYSLYSRWRLGRPPIGLTVFALGFGTQFPDLIDKPLTWTIPLLPYGRSLAHSLFSFVLILFVLRILFRYPDQRALTTAFGIGYGTHLIGDGLGPVLHGNYFALGYLLWPLTDVPEGHSRSFIEFFLSLEPTPMMLFGVALSVFTLLLWVYDGMPGIKDLFFSSHSSFDSTSAEDTQAQK